MHQRFIYEIPEDQFTLIRQVGTGTFSDIFSALHLQTNTQVALKVSLKTHIDEYDKLPDQEVKINKTLHHPFICKFFTEFETEHLNIIVMELIDGINALDYVNQTHGLPLTEVRSLFSQLIIVIEYLHNTAHITHRDLKLENIMIDSCGHIRLIDFGFSSPNLMMSTICGSIPYCAPEVLSGQLYTRASDIWSMGIILYALFDGSLPFYDQNMSALVNVICESEVKFPSSFDANLKDLLTGILDKDPARRMTIDQMKEHPFLAGEKLLRIDYKLLFAPEGDSIENDRSKIESINGPSLKKLALLNSMHNHEQLHKLITAKTDDVNTSISNRRNFASNLTKLIEFAFITNIYASEACESYDNLSLESTQFSVSLHDIDRGAPLLGVSENWAGSMDQIAQHSNNRHFVLTNHFAKLKSKKRDAQDAGGGGDVAESGSRSSRPKDAARAGRPLISLADAQPSTTNNLAARARPVRSPTYPAAGVTVKSARDGQRTANSPTSNSNRDSQNQQVSNPQNNGNICSNRDSQNQQVLKSTFPTANSTNDSNRDSQNQQLSDPQNNGNICSNRDSQIQQLLKSTFPTASGSAGGGSNRDSQNVKLANMASAPVTTVKDTQNAHLAGLSSSPAAQLPSLAQGSANRLSFPAPSRAQNPPNSLLSTQALNVKIQRLSHPCFQKNVIRRSHRRNSSNRAIVMQAPIVSPIVDHGSANLSEE